MFKFLKEKLQSWTKKFSAEEKTKEKKVVEKKPKKQDKKSQKSISTPKHKEVDVKEIKELEFCFMKR